MEKFIDGLEKPYSMHVGLFQPRSLNQASQFAMEEVNKIARKTNDFDFGRQKAPDIPNRNHQPPPIPNQTNNPFIPPKQKNNYPQNPFLKQMLRNFNNHNPFQKQFYVPHNPHRQMPNQFKQRPVFPLTETRFSLNEIPLSNNQQQFPKPEKMEVDPPLKINYMNRPKPAIPFVRNYSK